MPRFVYTYPSATEAHDGMLDDLFRSLTECGIDTAWQHAVSIAVSEAFTNAVIHGNRQDATKRVVLQLEVNDRQITADIIDQGVGGLKQVEAKRPSGELDESGRGVDLIRHYADMCQFAETEEGGLQVTLSFLRTKKSVKTV